MNKNNTSTFKRLLGLFTVYRWQLMMVLLMTVLQVAFSILIPILLGRAVNMIVGPGQVQIEPLKVILFQMALVIIGNTIIQWLAPLLYNRLVYTTTTALRQQVLEKLHHLPLAYVDRLSTGDLVSRVVTDVEQLSDGILMVFNQFFVGVLTIVVTIITMGSLDWRMMLMVVALTPLSLILARIIAGKSYRLFRKQTESRGEQTQMIEESIQQIEILRVFNAQPATNERFKQINQQYADHSQSAIFYSSITNPATRFINATIYALLTFVGATRIIKGNFTVGELTTFLNYVNQYTKPFNDISSVLAEIQGAFACAERLFEILDQPSEVETGTQQLNADSVEGRVDFQQVDFSYVPDRPLIEDLNLAVKAGQRVAIVGPTGAGKSTLINLLMRFYDVNQGHILLDGTPIMEYTRQSYRENFGMVLQETWLKSATVHENIAFGYPNATRELVVEAAKAAHADHFIQQLPQGYDTYLDNGGDALSIGQQQLLSIARLFVRVPQLLILDEATSSIDTRTEILIQSAFEQLMQGRTSFIIAHRLSTIQTADLILVMQNGQIVEQGNHQSLMKQQGLYYEMQQTRNVEEA
ncbi:ABC transporter ATP-binding protein [Globicatella sanguinis]|uniref:ABC transporter ATP-binding protein n=1 Tax=Globicatella sanguinis TaxID=13076 RepID=UPI0008252A9D|nr:ABC transporter ATP-binding protein [Globicatella sanguinis]MDK7629820.1 ABC transporter ATP-binding protein [Globicatella sanguinis]WIK67255.1 ABC transporter ATP-binding protein [Globicatella sanguinis]WKT56660.1 ABC transporter ATP-binding protein [Globicatella sanguinis]